MIVAPFTQRPDDFSKKAPEYLSSKAFKSGENINESHLILASSQKDLATDDGLVRSHELSHEKKLTINIIKGF